METIKIKDQDELIQFMKKENINNILIGNGFCLSHPELKNCFEWNLNTALNSDWGNMLPSISLNCPESDLNTIRVSITRKILEYYISNMFSKMRGKTSDIKFNTVYQKYKRIKYTCRDVLNLIASKDGNIFTLNYDPLLYFETLSNKLLFDGFINSNDNSKDGCLKEYYSIQSPGKFLKQDYVSCKLNNNQNQANLFFIHGSWFIQANEEYDIRKLNFNDKSSYNIDDLFSEKLKPFLILEDRWQTKEILIKANSYLDCCQTQLKNTKGNLLVFGVSFNKDDHILKTLNESNLNKIYVTYTNNDTKSSIENKAKKHGFNIYIEKSKENYIKIGDNVFWKLKDEFQHVKKEIFSDT